jgi:hypothetical protein
MSSVDIMNMDMIERILSASNITEMHAQHSPQMIVHSPVVSGVSMNDPNVGDPSSQIHLLNALDEATYGVL